MLKTVKTRQRVDRLAPAWFGAMASVALLASGAWTIRSARNPQRDPAVMLLDFLALFIIAAGLQTVAFLLITRRPWRRGRSR